MQNENLENQSNQVKKNPIEREKSIKANATPEKDAVSTPSDQSRKEVNLNRGAATGGEDRESRKFGTQDIKEGINKAQDTYERVKEKGLGGFDKGKLS